MGHIIEGQSQEDLGTTKSPIDVDPRSLDNRTRNLMTTFYGTIRAGSQRLSDGGGPFGFDVTKALLVDRIIDALQPEMIVETGCHTGDTTSYLARIYPDTTIAACDLDRVYVRIAKHRTRHMPNALVTCEDSRILVARAVKQDHQTLFYLDAHWGSDWPLTDELRSIRSGVVIIDDFDIGHRRFAFDSYDGIACDRALVAHADPKLTSMLRYPNVELDWPLPSLQVGRRSGWGIIIFDPLLRDALVRANLLIEPEAHSWRS